MSFVLIITAYLVILQDTIAVERDCSKQFFNVDKMKETLQKGKELIDNLNNCPAY
jgi:hypothetical protein